MTSFLLLTLHDVSRTHACDRAESSRAGLNAMRYRMPRTLHTTQASRETGKATAMN